MSKKKPSRRQKASAKKAKIATPGTTTADTQPSAARKTKTSPPGKALTRTAGKSGIISNINRRSALKILAGIGVTGVGVSSLHAYDKNQRTLHDLTVIGQGQPVVVQIHDPSCPTCRRLKSAVTTAMKSAPHIHYRLADITTPEGKALQDQYSVPHVTLLFFDGEGNHRHTTRGLMTPDQVRNNIDRYLS